MNTGYAATESNESAVTISQATTEYWLRYPTTATIVMPPSTQISVASGWPPVGVVTYDFTTGR